MSDQAEQLRRIMRQTRNAPPLVRRSLPSLRRTRVIAVSSGKGGVGKTNLVVNLAVVLGQAGRRVMIFDADLGLANVDVVLGIAPRYHLGSVIAGQKRLSEVVVAGPPNVWVIPGGSGVRELANLSERRRDEVITALQELDGSVDYLLIDTAAGVADDVAMFVAAADDALIVTTPEPTAITDAYALIKVVAALTPEPPTFGLVVNQVRDQAEGEEVAKKIAQVARTFLGVAVSWQGWIPSDPAVTKAVRRQEPVVLAYPNAPAALQIAALGRRLDRPLGGQASGPEEARSLSGFIRRVTQPPAHVG